ncbi:hypothetical protein CI109_101695 [Kwoniella shandongensis]|uniref:Uncharacterized protein n=1 Tax=Kwoniella shandongensis TaxID=1734106 RepID=A0A5M6C5H2_9TREE|nr:uncharacterized protein CI109_001181 [Kwoniella shandongensis]KAA5530378.1 hypothetical protein CI109_001181 [Kwoniella shandongensis]
MTPPRPSSRSEDTPLIHRSPSPVPVPIPWRSLIPVIFVRLCSGILYTMIFPYINGFVTSLHDVSPSHIGLYVGIAEGSLMAMEACFALFWARMADKFGRKRSLLMGFGVVTLCAAVVGFGKSIGWIIFWRAGVGLDACPVINKLIVSEISHSSNRAQIRAIFSLMFQLGMLLGTFLGGGMLAHPYGRLPWWLGGSVEFFREWPYALPGLVGAALALTALVTNAILLEEPKRHVTDTAQPADAVNDAIPSTNKKQSKSLAALKVPHFVTGNLVFTTFTLGGLGLSVDTIGLVLPLGSLLYVLCSPIAIPIIQRRCGIKRSIQLTGGTLPIEAMLIPIAQYAAVKSSRAMWGMLILQLGLKIFHTFVWTFRDQVLLGCFDNHPDLRATGSAIIMILGAFGRVLGPVLAGWSFSISTLFEPFTFGRQLSWLVLLAMSLPPVIMTSRFILDDRARSVQGRES